MVASAPRCLAESGDLSALMHASCAFSFRRDCMATWGRMMAWLGVECALAKRPALFGSGERDTMNLTEPLFFGFVMIPVAVNVTDLGGILNAMTLFVLVPIPFAFFGRYMPRQVLLSRVFLLPCLADFHFSLVRSVFLPNFW